MMTAMRVEAGRGWGWIVEGWQLFSKAPGMWVAIMLIYALISMALLLIPFIGELAYTILAPVFLGGMVYAAALTARSERLELGHLFEGFRNQERMGPLVLLGLISLGGTLIIAVIIIMFIGGSVVLGVAINNGGSVAPSEAVGVVFIAAIFLVSLLILAFATLIMMAMFYGIPLVMLGKQDAWPAAQASIAACWINIRPLLVFGLIYILLGIVALIPFGLGLFILGPVTICALYASYQEVLEETPLTQYSDKAQF